MRVGDIFTGPRGRRYEVIGPGGISGKVCVRALWGFNKEDEVDAAFMVSENWKKTTEGKGERIRGT